MIRNPQHVLLEKICTITSDSNINYGFLKESDIMEILSKRVLVISVTFLFVYISLLQKMMEAYREWQKKTAFDFDMHA